MNHGLNNTFLYTACKLTSTFKCTETGKTLTGIGTSFFLLNRKSEICLITNRHNIDKDYKEPTAKYKTFKLDKLIVDNRLMNEESGLPNKIIELDVSNFEQFKYSDVLENDIACLIGIELNSEQQEIAFSIPYDVIADEDKINTELSVCDFIAYPGFPDWYDKLNNNPILRTGTIASDPRFNYSNTKENIGECIAYEAFSFGGSSGSPIFALQKGFPVSGAIQANENFYRPVMLIGINAGHLLVEGHDRQHAGISLMYKSSSILQIIDK